MKKYNGLLWGSVLLYILAAFLLWKAPGIVAKQQDMYYKVEVNGLLEEARRGTPAEEISLEECHYVKAIRFLSRDRLEEEVAQMDFFSNQNQKNTVTKPLFIQQEWKGYLCFDYVLPGQSRNLMVFLEIMLFLLFVIIWCVLVYIRAEVLTPFFRFQNMPYEMAKGHLREELPESRERYFGKFLWGLSMLQSALQSSRKKELQLLKEKKTLLLELSHDIKIPLSTIRLYARSIYEDVAETPEAKKEYAVKIEQHAVELEMLVKKIMGAVSEEVLSIEVQSGDFYLQDYVDRVKGLYDEKCKRNGIIFEIGAYENHILHGDFERAVEVMENLMENALKYGDGRKIALRFYEEEYCQIVEVFNTGEAVREQEIPHLFDSFFRGSNVRDKDGNGLGLYICKQIMTKMEGDIYLKSTKDGMHFCLVFHS